MRLAQTAQTVASRLRAWAAEGQSLIRAGCGLTPREREGALLLTALFVLGLAVQWLRWMFS